MRLLERLKEQDENLYNDLIRIKNNSDKITNKPLHYDYTDHGIKHSERMIKHLDNLLKKFMNSDKKMNSAEIFILLSAVYLHDIGMQLHKKEKLKEMFSEMNFNDVCIPKFVRNRHAEISKIWIEKNLTKDNNYETAYDSDPEYGEIIGKIIEAHNIDLRKYLYSYSSEKVVKTSIVREDLLAVLLCLADALDLNSERVKIESLKSQDINEESKLHWFTHHYTSGVSCDNGKIQIGISFPKVLNNFYEKETYKKHFGEIIPKWIKYNLENFRETLHKNDIHIILKDISFIESVVKEKLSDGNYRKIEKLDCKLIKKTIQNFDKEIIVNIQKSKDGITLECVKKSKYIFDLSEKSIIKDEIQKIMWVIK